MIYIEPTPYILGLIRELAKLGTADIEVIFLQENVTQQWNLSLADYRAEVLSDSLVRSAETIYKRIAEGNYQVIHLAGWGHKLLLIALFLARLRRIPVAMESDTQLPFEQALWKRAVKAVLYPLLFKIPSILLPGGTRQKEYFRHYGVSDDRIRVVNMTVDVTYIMKLCRKMGEAGRKKIRSLYGFSENNIVFIFVGRLVEYKGISTLLAAFSALAERHKNARLLIVGDGLERDFVVKKSAEIHTVCYAGRLGFAEVIAAYHAADVCIVPSLFEPWGLVVNEAMAAGLPVIVSERVGCIDDLITDKGTGLVIAAGNRANLIEAMEGLISNPALRKIFSNNALSLISGWTLERAAALYYQAWEKVIDHES